MTNNLKTKSGDPKEGKSKWRKIIIETDGDEVRITRAEVSGAIELATIFKLLFDKVRSEKVISFKVGENKDG